MELTFLGTSAMLPTKERNPSAFFLKYKDHGILFDCGEGTQRQMKITGIPLTKITKILITHWHGDHVFGLPGLIQSLSASEYKETLEIYGPKGTKKSFEIMKNFVEFNLQIKLKVQEIEDGVFFENKDFYLEAMYLKHKIPCLGYCFVEKNRRKINVDTINKLGIPYGPLIGELQQGKSIVIKGKRITPDKVSTILKGRKICFITDTQLTKNCYVLAKNADILICEGTYTSKLEDKAYEYLHMTAKDAGLVASKSGVKKLILTHFSARYKNTLELEEDVRQVFDNIICAKDFLRLNV